MHKIQSYKLFPVFVDTLYVLKAFYILFHLFKSNVIVHFKQTNALFSGIFYDFLCAYAYMI